MSDSRAPYDLQVDRDLARIDRLRLANVVEVLADHFPEIAVALREAAESGVVGDATCEMCGEDFDAEWADEEARAEATAKGLDPDDCGVVCDECYKLTPWGVADDSGVNVQPTQETFRGIRSSTAKRFASISSKRAWRR